MLGSVITAMVTVFTALAQLLVMLTRGIDLSIAPTLGIAALAPLPARFLSAGQRRRLALARVVARGAPLWLLGVELVPLLEGLSGPPFELADALQRAVDAGLDVEGIEIGATRDLTYPVDLVRENFPYLES